MGGSAQLGTLGRPPWLGEQVVCLGCGGGKLGQRVEERPGGAGRRGIPAVLKVGAASQTPPGLLLNSDSTSALQCLGHWRQGPHVTVSVSKSVSGNWRVLIHDFWEDELWNKRRKKRCIKPLRLPHVDRKRKRYCLLSDPYFWVQKADILRLHFFLSCVMMLLCFTNGTVSSPALF